MAKILVIDDDQGIRQLIDMFLRRRGYDVLLAENGQSGLELLLQELPDVIVLDLKMSDMDGVTVLRYIRSLNRDQPVIIYFGACTPKAEQEIRALGITDFVRKDSSLDRLEQGLKRALGSPDLGEEGLLPKEKG